MSHHKIFILYTGGTIGMAPSDIKDPHSPLVPKNWEQLSYFMPSIKPGGYFSQRGISFHYHSFPEPLDSSQITPEHWIKISNILYESYDDYDGFIIIHGTDTMAYSASMLSFFFNGLTKPIVFTGSQLPISHSRTDAINNFSNSIHIAASEVFGLPTVPEVSICFNDRLLRGNRSSKLSTRDFEGFESPNYGHLAQLEEHIVIHSRRIREISQPNRKPVLMNKLGTRVLDLSLFPGLSSDTLRRLLGEDELDGLILRTYGAGNAPMNADFLKTLKDASVSGTLILNITQCFHGGVDMQKYRAGKTLLENGVVSGRDLTKEAALTKMMWVLGNFEGEDRIKALCTDQRGEMS